MVSFYKCISGESFEEGEGLRICKLAGNLT